MPDVNFVITAENLETGMRGYPVGYCVTSSVDPEKGLFYMGRPVDELAFKEPEAVIYLLYHGKDPNAKELEAFKKDLAKRSKLKPETEEAIRKLPKEGHPMKLLSIALLLAGMMEGTDDYREDGLNVVAKIPSIVAILINHHAGWPKGAKSDPSLGYMENFTRMLGVPGANLEVLTEVMKIFNVLHYDHGGGNLSTFIGKGVASGLADMYASLAASMDALAGPRHGKANQDCLQFVQDVLKEAGENATGDKIEKLIRDKLENKELVYGFGHAVLRVEDPRATVFYAIAKKDYPNHPLVKIALHLRERGSKVLGENPKISDPHPNVDAISGTILAAAGFNYPEYFTVLFGLSRCVGISRQIIYERLEARDGKGTPIVRPKYYFKKLEGQ